jgi:hypothetical protein
MTVFSAVLQHSKKLRITEKLNGRFRETFLVLAYAVVRPKVGRLRQADVQVQVRLVNVEVFRRDHVLVLEEITYNIIDAALK